jgi:hypothetical protein
MTHLVLNNNHLLNHLLTHYKLSSIIITGKSAEIDVQ